jgi:helix-turn-helix protein
LHAASLCITKSLRTPHYSKASDAAQLGANTDFYNDESRPGLHQSGGSREEFTTINVSPAKGNINRYRDACRKLIYACRDPELTRARKNVLLALVDAVNDKEGYTAWPAFDTLAERVGVDRRTAIRAINVGRKLRILQRIYKGGQTWRGGTSNRYRFCIDPVSGESLGQRVPDDNLMSGQTPTQCQSGAQPRRSIP